MWNRLPDDALLRKTNTTQDTIFCPYWSVQVKHCKHEDTVYAIDPAVVVTNNVKCSHGIGCAPQGSIQGQNESWFAVDKSLVDWFASVPESFVLRIFLQHSARSLDAFSHYCLLQFRFSFLKLFPYPILFSSVKGYPKEITRKDERRDTVRVALMDFYILERPVCLGVALSLFWSIFIDGSFCQTNSAYIRRTILR